MTLMASAADAQLAPFILLHKLHRHILMVLLVMDTIITVYLPLVLIIK